MKYACRSQQTILGSQFPSSAMWVLGIELRSAGLVESAVTPGPLVLRQDVSLNPELIPLATSHSCLLDARIAGNSHTRLAFVDSEDLICGHHACTASTLST